MENLSTNIHPDFHKIFITNESKVLLGNNYVNFWILLSMLSITFLAIGFSNGSLDYLAEKMKDPFVNSVKVVVPTFSANRISDIVYDLNQDSLIKSTYHFKNLTGYYKYPLSFMKYGENNEAYEFYGRTINLSNPLMDKILASNNIFSGRSFLSKEDVGIIVTKVFLNKLGYAPNEKFINLVEDYNGLPKNFPIPVIAVVKDLPDNANFVTTPYFYNLIYYDIKNEGSLNFDNSENLILFTMDTLIVYDLRKAVDTYLGINYKTLDYYVSSPSVSYLSVRKGFKIMINFSDYNFNKISLIDSIFITLNNAPELSEFSFFQLYDIKAYTISEQDEGYGAYDRISVNFNKLDKVKEFRSFFLKKSNLDIDMGQIESRENYNLVSSLTRILSVVLIGFSILSISLFLSNIFKRHLEKIKMNIGTFKAFGIDNKTLQLIYFKLVGGFIITVMFFSFIIASVIGYLGFIKTLFQLLSINYDKNETYFHIFDKWTLFSVSSILVVCFFILYLIINKILIKTPGDLIYDR